MKKIFSILLLIIMMLCTAGYYIAYKYNRSVVKTEMRSAISSGSYQQDHIFTIVVPLKNKQPVANGFEQLEEYEIRYHGNMYDVVEARWDKDKVTFLCLDDKDETKLVSIFTEQLQKQNDDHANGSKPALLIKFSISPFTETKTVSLKCTEVNTAPQILICGASDKLAIAYQNIPSPPPWKA